MFTERVFDMQERKYLSVEGFHIVRHVTNVAKQRKRAPFFFIVDFEWIDHVAVAFYSWGKNSNNLTSDMKRDINSNRIGKCFLLS